MNVEIVILIHSMIACKIVMVIGEENHILIIAATALVEVQESNHV